MKKIIFILLTLIIMFNISACAKQPTSFVSKDGVWATEASNEESNLVLLINLFD